MARKKQTRGDCVYCGKDYTRGGFVPARMRQLIPDNA